MIDSLFYPMIGNTAVVSVVILFLLLFSKIIRSRYRPGWRWAVGIMLAVRLLLPFRMPLPEYVVPQAIVPPAAQSQTQVSPAERAALPAGTERDTAAAAKTWNTAAVLWAAERIWLIGILGFSILAFVRYEAAKRRLRRWRLPAEPPLGEMAVSIREQLGLRKNVPVYVSDQIDSPMLVGLLRPAVYLPAGTLSQEEAAMVLRHELIHCCRRDLWCKLLMLAANAVHWFNPLVYYLRRDMDEAMERICDSRVIMSSDAAERKIYAGAMLAVMKQKVDPALRIGARFFGGAKSMRERIGDILQIKTKKRGIWMGTLVGILLLLGSVGCTAPDATSVGIIGGADGPTAIYVAEDGEQENDPVQMLQRAILQRNAGEPQTGEECPAAGVIVLGASVEGSETVYYCLTRYGNFGFENGYLTKVSGTGTIPVRMRFDQDMNLIEYTVPMDGSYYESSIREMFPDDLQAAALSPAEAIENQLTAQEMEYARAYLEKIGREAEIVYNWRLEKGCEMPEISAQASNQLPEQFPMYPYWIGTVERIENGVRYVYETSWQASGPETGTIRFSKYAYGAGETPVEQYTYFVQGDEVRADGAE